VTAKPISKYRDSSLFVVAALFIVTCAVVIFPKKALAIIVSVPVLALVTCLFFSFLFDMIRDVRRRTSIYIAVFIASHIAAMIILFANIYRWVGLRYLVTPTTDKHALGEQYIFLW
jgi:hypothetical protein